MISYIRTGTVAPGKWQEAMAFAYKVVKIGDAITGAKTNIGLPIGGTVGRISWVTPFENMAAIEAATYKLMNDADYNKMIDSAGLLFLPGSVHDEMWWFASPEDLKKAA